MGLRLPVFLVCAGAVLAGLALGAASQRETILDIQDPATSPGSTAGNVVFVTALLVAFGVGGGAVALAAGPLRPSLVPAGVAAVAAYVATVAVQSAWPFYLHVVELRHAILSINPLVHNASGTASTLLAPMAIVLAGVLGVGWAGRRLFRGHGDDGHEPLRRHIAAAAVAGPFLVIAAVGSLQVLGALGPSAAGAHAWILPTLAAVCAALLALLVRQAWALAAVRRNSRLAPLVASEWRGLGRLQLALLGLLVVLGAAAARAASQALPGLELGTTLGVTTRSHVVLAVLAILAAHVPCAVSHRRAARALEAPRSQPTLETAGADAASVSLVLAVVAAAGLAVLAASLAHVRTPEPPVPDGALWPWLGALAPFALVAWKHGTRGMGSVAALLLALTLWGIGNSVAATFDGFEHGLLVHVTDPEILALWRVAGALVLAVTVRRLARAMATPGSRRGLPTVAAVGVAAVALLELPLGAWVLTGGVAGESVALGSVVAAQDAGVEAIMHMLAMGAALAAAWALAMLARPDWFADRSAEAAAPAAAAARR